MNIELTESERQTLLFYLQKNLVDAKGMHAIGVGSEKTVKNIESIAGKLSGAPKPASKKSIWVLTGYDTDQPGVYFEKVFGKLKDIRKRLVGIIREQKDLNPSYFDDGTLHEDEVEVIVPEREYRATAFFLGDRRFEVTAIRDDSEKINIL